MHVAVHAILLAAIPVVVAYALARGWSRPSPGRIAAACLGALLLMALGLSLGVHACARGQPIAQWLVPGLGFALVFCGIGNRTVRAVLASALAVMALALPLDFAQVVHERGWIGRPDAPPAATGQSAMRVRRTWHSTWTGIYRTSE